MISIKSVGIRSPLVKYRKFMNLGVMISEKSFSIKWRDNAFRFAKIFLATMLCRRSLRKVLEPIYLGPDKYRMKLFQRLRPSFYELSKNNFGCRVIQKLLDFITPYEELQGMFLQEICPQVKTLIHDMYGNYVLLKCLETMQKEKLEFIIKPVEDSVMSTHKHSGPIHGTINIWVSYHLKSSRIVHEGINCSCSENHNEYGNATVFLRVRKLHHIIHPEEWSKG
jgi:hypothetical protein